MIIVIDGYNVLKQASDNIEIPQYSKDNFIKQLSKYGKEKGHAMLVVFDGGSTERPDKERIGNVTVVHSGFGESADDWIKKYMQQHKGHDLLLVSTDRELGTAVRRLGIPCIDSIDFYTLLQESCKSAHRSSATAGSLVKTTEDQIPYLDELMQQASRIVHSKLDDMIVKKERKSSSHMISKSERATVKKLKKL